MSDRELVKAAVAKNIDRHPMIDSSQSHIREIRVGWITDAVLAALSAAGRLRAEVKGDVVEAAARAMDLHWRKTSKPWPGGADHEWTWHSFVPQVEAVAGIIAADAERRVRADLAKQMRGDAEANRVRGMVEAAAIFDDIANDLEADHA